MEGHGLHVKPTARRRVLVVDDDEAFAHAVTKILREAGLSVRYAPDYRLALRLLEGDQPIDLLLTDIVMPQRVNGFALARMARMRRHEIKVLYVTAYDIPGVEDEALGVVLRKPIDNDRLIAEVSRALGSN